LRAAGICSRRQRGRLGQRGKRHRPPSSAEVAKPQIIRPHRPPSSPSGRPGSARQTSNPRRDASPKPDPKPTPHPSSPVCSNEHASQEQRPAPPAASIKRRAARQVPRSSAFPIHPSTTASSPAPQCSKQGLIGLSECAPHSSQHRTTRCLAPRVHINHPVRATHNQTYRHLSW